MLLRLSPYGSQIEHYRHLLVADRVSQLHGLGLVPSRRQHTQRLGILLLCKLPGALKGAMGMEQCWCVLITVNIDHSQH